jgi:2-polyprenyl-3-methyl-5-hydroxy-6-metoxy-1,4-benzoquinol methylase
MNDSDIYYTEYAAAFVRGTAKQSNKLILPQMLLEKSLEELNKEEVKEIISLGKAADFKLHRFKKSLADLPRVRRVLGFLKSISMASLLDVGSGRGAFLWPCLNTFPCLSVLSIELLSHRVDMLNAVKLGGISRLSIVKGDICAPPIADNSCDVVTMLEVLEHIPDPSSAVAHAIRVAKKYVVVSVPSRQDNNPEHIHLLTKEILTDIFHKAGCTRLHFDGVAGHLILIAVLEI